jgi:hypothetical protein
VELLFSEVVNHLRSAIDNVVCYIVEMLRGTPLCDGAHLVAMPIVQTAGELENWG